VDVNLEGELGDGNGGNASETPVVVQGGHAFQEVAAGAAHTCGLTAAGAAYCWGGNDAGQLGHDNAGTDRDKGGGRGGWAHVRHPGRRQQSHPDQAVVSGYAARGMGSEPIENGSAAVKAARCLSGIRLTK
jgi:hypothetical protein